MNKYFIKEGYIENIVDGKPAKVYKKPPPGDKYQISVFKHIRKFIINKKPKIESIIDLGCGSAYKLNKYIGDLGIPITAVEQDFAVEIGKERYPNLNWTTDDFSKDSTLKEEKYDVIISSDVIEHLVHPEFLLNRIKQYAHENTHIFISTPERDLVRGKESIGPPENIKHVREWNNIELTNYLENEGFKVINSKILPAKKLTFRERINHFRLRNSNNTCQLIECKIK